MWVYLEMFIDQCLVVMYIDMNIGGVGGFNIGMIFVIKIVDWVVVFDDDVWLVFGVLD